MAASSDSEDMASSRSCVTGSSRSLEEEEADGADVFDEDPLNEGDIPEEDANEEEEEEDGNDEGAVEC